MKITIDVKPEVVEALRAYAVGLDGRDPLPDALRSGLACIARVALEARADEQLWKSQGLVTQCAWCNHFKGVLGWSLALTSAAVAIAKREKRITHGICPACLRQQQEKESAPCIAEIAAEAECLAIRADASANGRVEAGLTSSSLPPVVADLHEDVLCACRSDARSTADAVPAGV